jgi:L-glutamine:2-deoxy-scyllo-inosose/3-amino-2,3-dideoxy-scyllo-inosose aminotransferase
VLDEQHAVRNRNYQRLAEQLTGEPGIHLLRHDPRQNRLSLYEVPVVFEDLSEARDNAWVAEALSAELGTHVYPPRTSGTRRSRSSSDAPASFRRGVRTSTFSGG